jgi:hypothetical protein
LRAAPRSLPGDFGFDPLYLGEDKEQLKWCAGRRERSCSVAGSAALRRSRKQPWVRAHEALP